MLIRPSSTPAPDGKIVVSDGGNRIVIALNALLRIESRRVYTILHVKGRHEIICCKNLGVIEESLPADVFVKIHRSCLVNLYEIRSYIQGGRGGTVVLSDTSEHRIAQRRKAEFLRRVNQFIRTTRRVHKADGRVH